MSKKRNIIIAILVFGIIGVMLIAPKFLIFWSGQASTVNVSSQAFFIKKETTLESLVEQLKNEGIIDSPSDFMAVGDYKAITAERIASGKYMIEPGTSYRTLINGFTLNGAGNGNAEVAVEVTFNNCKTIQQMVGKVSHCLDLDSSAFMAALKDGENMKKYGFTWDQWPAMFLPNTYQMYFDTDVTAFMDAMANEFKDYWTDERREKLISIGLTRPSEASTLASIVYAEQSKNEDEWSIIAGLYLNRVNIGMRLQSDPTFKFCWGSALDGVQRLLAKHREIDCPFNTYKIKGLPPGPINLPSSKVIDAVLNRADVNYLYMCAQANYEGRHNFAISGADHLKNAKIFQNWLAAELKRKQ